MEPPSTIRQSLDSRRRHSASPVIRNHHAPSYSVPYMPSPSLSSRTRSPERTPLAKPTESDKFLTLLATQERRVLELKEDLHKAEADLEKLKKQWAVHEARKKRNELRGSKQLQPLSTAALTLPRECVLDLSNGSGSGGEGDERVQNPEKRSLSHRGESTRKPQRRVFQGSRQTKTLSLLSPTKVSTNGELQAVNQPPLLNGPSGDEAYSREKLARAETTPNLSLPLPSNKGIPLTTSAGSPTRTKEDIFHPAKQLVGDFREGLWTFFEDLRQATVGDDLPKSDPRRQHTKRDSSSPQHPVMSTSPHKPLPLPQVAPQRAQPAEEGRRPTRARRASSKNEGYAFRMEQVPGKKANETMKLVHPASSDDSHHAASQRSHLPLPQPPVSPPMTNTRYYSATNNNDDAAESAIVDNLDDSWASWDSSPIAARSNTACVDRNHTTTTTSPPRPLSSITTTSSSLASPTTPTSPTVSNSSVRTSVSLSDSFATPRPVPKPTTAAAASTSPAAKGVSSPCLPSASSPKIDEVVTGHRSPSPSPSPSVVAAAAAIPWPAVK